MNSKFLTFTSIICAAIWMAPRTVMGQGSTSGSSGVPTVTLTNPLGNITLLEFLNRILDIIIIFAIPIIVFFIIFAGFKYVTANGNQAKVGEATRSLTYAVVGGVIILGAKALLVIIQNTVNALRM